MGPGRSSENAVHVVVGAPIFRTVAEYYVGIVALDDVVVATRKERAFSTDKSTVFIGENPLGGGVTGSQFNGMIVSKAIWRK